ncbi:MAG: shikimate kinase [Flavobacterium sp.]
MKKVILVGYMGSGKTQVGKILASLTGLPFIDLDIYIEQKFGKTIQKIFKENGELFFRKLEHESWSELMLSNESFVLSTGGGAPCYANNHIFLQAPGVCSINLKTSINELESRLKNETKQRPLLQNLEEEPLSEYIAKHLFERSYFYHQAKQTIVTDAKSPYEIAQEINEVLSNQSC